jgi:hypothetical protein
VTALRSARKRSWPPLVRSAHTGCPTDGVVLCALAFSTLLSSQGAGAHLRRALTRLQGNRLNLPDSETFVNSVRQNFANSWPCLALQGSPSRRPARTARGLGQKLLVAPRDLALSRPSPRGKKNFRGAPRLRQIGSGNRTLTQVRRGVTGRVLNVFAGAWAASARQKPADNLRKSDRTAA